MPDMVGPVCRIGILPLWLSKGGCKLPAEILLGTKLAILQLCLWTMDVRISSTGYFDLGD